MFYTKHILLLGAILFASCNDGDDLQYGQPTKQKYPVQINCRTKAEVAMRSTLNANGKALTDIFIFDYDKTSGDLLQVLHQTSDAEDFAEPKLMLDYGEHVLKIVATRSESPTLLDTSGKAWGAAANVLTAISEEVPTVLANDKTSDTFGSTKEITVGIGLAQAVNITLDRIVAKLVIKSTDTFPEDCSTIEMTLNEYRQFSWPTFDVSTVEKNKRITDVSSLAGKTGTTVSYFVLSPKKGYTTDISFVTNKKAGSPYADITVPDVPFERNKVTTITGSFYNHQQGFSFSLNDVWSSEGNDINI